MTKNRIHLEWLWQLKPHFIQAGIPCSCFILTLELKTKWLQTPVRWGFSLIWLYQHYTDEACIKYYTFKIILPRPLFSLAAQSSKHCLKYWPLVLLYDIENVIYCATELLWYDFSQSAFTFRVLNLLLRELWNYITMYAIPVCAHRRPCEV